MTSRTSYPEFYARDFGRCVFPLIKLGYKDKVKKTYEYAFNIYKKEKKFSLIITPQEKLFDFPKYSPDGFAFFLLGLTQLNDKELISENKAFLQKELNRFVELVINKKTGLVKKNKHFSDAQDYSIRNSGSYTNVACFVVQQSASKLGLRNPLKKYDYKKLFLKHFWNGLYFYDDLDKKNYFSADANIEPFREGLFVNKTKQEREMFFLIDKKLETLGMNNPFPTKYHPDKKKEYETLSFEFFNKWERDSVWLSLGISYLESLKSFDKEKHDEYLDKYKEMIETERCFPELLDSKTGKPFKSMFYTSEDSMLWASNVLWLLKERRRKEKKEREKKG